MVTIAKPNDAIRFLLSSGRCCPRGSRTRLPTVTQKQSNSFSQTEPSINGTLSRDAQSDSSGILRAHLHGKHGLKAAEQATTSDELVDAIRQRTSMDTKQSRSTSVDEIRCRRHESLRDLAEGSEMDAFGTSCHSDDLSASATPPLAFDPKTSRWKRAIFHRRRSLLAARCLLNYIHRSSHIHCPSKQRLLDDGGFSEGTKTAAGSSPANNAPEMPREDSRAKSRAKVQRSSAETPTDRLTKGKGDPRRRKRSSEKMGSARRGEECGVALGVRDDISEARHAGVEIMGTDPRKTSSNNPCTERDYSAFSSRPGSRRPNDLAPSEVVHKAVELLLAASSLHQELAVALIRRRLEETPGRNR